MPQASEAAQNYLIDLFVDCGFTLVERRAFLNKRFGNKVLGELSAAAVWKATEELKGLKERKWHPENQEGEREEVP